MTIFIFIVVIATSIWVLIDAHILGVRKGVVKGLGDMGPFGWFFASLLLWIIAFPLYLGMRPKYVKARSENKTEHTGAESIDQLEKLAKMKEKGIITKEEFEKKKKEILNL